MKQLISIGWLISIFVIGANISLVVFSIVPYVGVETALGICLLILLVVVSATYMGFLIYLSRYNVDKVLALEISPLEENLDAVSAILQLVQPPNQRPYGG